MPTRYLKPGIRDSGHIEMLADCPEAENLYYRLLVTVDDFGRFDARPLVIKGQCFPLRVYADADKCMQWLKRLELAGLIVLYTVDNKEYLQMTKWDNKPRAESSKFPPFSDACIQLHTVAPLTVTVTGTKTETDIPKLKPKKTRAAHEKNGFELPDWIPAQPWCDWIEMRQKIRKPATDTAKRIAITKLKYLERDGFPPAQVLMQSTFNSWAGLFPIKEQK